MKYLSNNFTGELGVPKTSFEIKKEDGSLIFSFVAHDSYLYSYSKKNNDDLWKGCVTEVFLDLGDKDFYYEFEVAPNGAVFVAKKFVDHLEFPQNYFFIGISKIYGKDYEVTMEVDLTKLKISKNIKYNAFRVENETAKEKSKNLFALSPTFSDTFHVRDKFIDL